MDAACKKCEVCCAECVREMKTDEIKSIVTGTHGSHNRSEEIYIFAHPVGLILDIGCGEGAKMDYFETLGTTKEVIGVDIAESILNGKPNRICADAQYLPFKSNTFDSIICSEVLEHLPNPELCVKDIHRVLKRKGIVFFSTPVLNIHFPILIPIFRKISGAESAKVEHLHVFSAKKICHIIDGYLEIVDIKHLGYTTVFRRLESIKFNNFRKIVDIRLSDLSKKVSFLRYFASQAWIKCVKET